MDPLGHDDLELNDLTKVGKEYAWEVEGKLAEYFNKNARKFIPTKTIKEHILDECPVPSNLLDTPKLDTALAAVIPEGHTALNEVEAPGGIWESIRNIAAPQMFLWQEIESLRRVVKSAEAENQKVDPEHPQAWKIEIDIEGVLKPSMSISIFQACGCSGSTF